MRKDIVIELSYKRSLQENIVRYESNVGKIEIPTPPPVPETGPKMGEA